MAPWKIVLHLKRLAGLLECPECRNQRKNPSNCFYNLLQSVTFYKYKNIHGMYKYTISANNKALTRWLNRCIPMKDNTMYCPP